MYEFEYLPKDEPLKPKGLSPTQWAITLVMDEIEELLIEKNRAYGNSFADPINVFSKATAQEQLYVRIDDKLNRVAKGGEYPGDDTILDLIGYLVLLRVLNKETV